MSFTALQRHEILNRILKHYQAVPHHASKNHHHKRGNFNVKLNANPLQSTYMPATSSSSTSTAAIRFPGAMPVSLMREDIIKLYNGHRTYVFLIKSDGLRVLLYFDRMGGTPFVITVNRSLDLVVCKTLEAQLPADCSLFNGTLWDCEAMSDGSFQVFDNVLTNGLPCGHYDFITRMLIVRHNLWFLRERRLPISDKPFHSLKQVGTLLQTRHAFPTDGLIAMPVEDIVYTGHCPVMFKLKRCFDNTLDFLVYQVPWNQYFAKSIIPFNHNQNGTTLLFQLWVEWNTWENESNPTYERNLKDAAKMAWNGTTYVCWGYTTLSSDELQDRFPQKVNLHQKIVECRRRSHTDPVWRMHVLRNDKAKPNTLSTALRTCRNIDENLTYETIFPFLLSSSSASSSSSSSSSSSLDPYFLPHLKRHESVFSRSKIISST